MKKVVNRRNGVMTRHRLANPFLYEAMIDRYKKEMRNNHIISQASSGYLTIKPIDPNKIY